MKQGITKFSEEELLMLVKMTNTKGFTLLKRLHNEILEEMRKINEERIDFTKEDIADHAKRIGHKMAWGIDADLPNIIKREKERRDKLANNLK